nr:uncharacterized protein K02A2.6-like [Dermacentor andersoni]
MASQLGQMEPFDDSTSDWTSYDERLSSYLRANKVPADIQVDVFQVEMDEESKAYLTLNTSKGLYVINRLPFGIASAPAIFQKIVDNILKGLDGVTCYIDDIMVTGKTEQEHLKNLEAVLRRLSDRGIRVKKEKCEFFKDKLQYLGHVISAHGIEPATDKLEAIAKAPRPTDKQQLHSLLGLINYYGKFVPNLSNAVLPLNRLLRLDVPWAWSDECEAAFSHIKQLLSQPPVLAHYDPSAPLQLSCDASAYGIGAVISHVEPNGPFKGAMFLVVVDAHSKWPEVCQMRDTSAENTVNRLHEIFCRFGYPEVVVSDNGPQFISAVFSNYLKSIGTRHVRTSAYHPSSNGQAERFVQTLKTALRKSTAASLSTTLGEFLLSYRNTPHATTGEAPATLLLQRRLRTRLDAVKPSLQQKVSTRQFVQTVRRKQRAREFAVGESVLVRNFRRGAKWLPGIVLGRTGPVSYRVRVETGRGVFAWKRHQNHIIQARDMDFPYIPEQRDYPEQPRPDSPDPVQPASSSLPATAERRYPARQRRPRDRYVP